MSSLLLLGNGESRQGIDINLINMYKVGCNAIYRDFYVDELVCVDRRMVIEACENGYTNTVYTRPNWAKHFKSKYPNVTEVPKLPYEGTQRHDDPFHWGSGNFAQLVACNTHYKTIYVLGFDLYGSGEGQHYHNNIYKGTDNYNSVEHRAVDPRYWVIHFSKLAEIFYNKKFVILAPNDWKRPKGWAFNNIEKISIDNVYDIC
jgi:hypothetical protein